MPTKQFLLGYRVVLGPDVTPKQAKEILKKIKKIQGVSTVDEINCKIEVPFLK